MNAIDETASAVAAAITALDTHEQRAGERLPMNDLASAAAYCRLRHAGLDREELGALWLDSARRLIDFQTLAVGTRKGVPAFPREIVRAALAREAAAVIFTHNHVDSGPEPSDPDRAFTRALEVVLSPLQVKVVDYIVTGRGGTFASFAQMGLLSGSTVQPDRFLLTE